jgi:hypothetical protein
MHTGYVIGMEFSQLNRRRDVSLGRYISPDVRRLYSQATKGDINGGSRVDSLTFIHGKHFSNNGQIIS